MISPFLSLQSAFHNSDKTCSENLSNLSKVTQLWTEECQVSSSPSPAAPNPSACADHVFQMDCICCSVNVPIGKSEMCVWSTKARTRSLVKTHFSLWLVSPDILVLWWQLVITRSLSTSKPSNSFQMSAFCLAPWVTLQAPASWRWASCGTSTVGAWVENPKEREKSVGEIFMPRMSGFIVTDIWIITFQTTVHRTVWLQIAVNFLLAFSLCQWYDN